MDSKASASRSFASMPARSAGRAAHRSVPHADLLIAATAEISGIELVHYDRDYDLIAQKTDLRFDSVWLSEPGQL